MLQADTAPLLHVCLHLESSPSDHIPVPSFYFLQLLQKETKHFLTFSKDAATLSLVLKDDLKSSVFQN